MEDPEAAASFRSAGIAAFEKARALAPQEEIYAFELASALDKAGRFEEAEAVYYDLFRLDPRSDSLRRSYDWHLELWRRSGTTERSAAPRRADDSNLALCSTPNLNPRKAKKKDC